MFLFILFNSLVSAQTSLKCPSGLEMVNAGDAH